MINSALVVTAHHALFSFPMLAFSLLVWIINSLNLNSNRVTSFYPTWRSRSYLIPRIKEEPTVTRVYVNSSRFQNAS